MALHLFKSIFITTNVCFCFKEHGCPRLRGIEVVQKHPRHFSWILSQGITFLHGLFLTPKIDLQTTFLVQCLRNDPSVRMNNAHVGRANFWGHHIEIPGTRSPSSRFPGGVDVLYLITKQNRAQIHVLATLLEKSRRHLALRPSFRGLFQNMSWSNLHVADTIAAKASSQMLYDPVWR